MAGKVVIARIVGIDLTRSVAIFCNAQPRLGHHSDGSLLERPICRLVACIDGLGDAHFHFAFRHDA